MSGEASPLPEGRTDGRAAYDDADAWKDNYDGMFARWAECDAERVALKEQVWSLELRLRIVLAAPVVAVPGREAVAVAIAKAADWEQCFNLPYDDDGSTSDTEDRDYFRRLADAALAVVAIPEAGERPMTIDGMVQCDCEAFEADPSSPDPDDLWCRCEHGESQHDGHCQGVVEPAAPVVGEREEKP